MSSKVTSTKATAGRLLTAEDLAERWSCAVRTALARVREKGVPFVWLGPGQPRLTEAGQKLIRFRPDAVDAWELRQQTAWASPAGGAEAAATPAPLPAAALPGFPGWDGKDRLGLKKPRRSAGKPGGKRA